ncbi:hypothetical protein NDU88_003014 [Pleurodeles waltl]|uniref:Uncharacterized protein n=1 Tax=Pleurodeles waltl TaxID=8319 RepID=A0AAV7VE59_PLEWA|nr:hypothetical protein NDU88_003014 [Pleurodeles waltl]
MGWAVPRDMCLPLPKRCAPTALVLALMGRSLTWVSCAGPGAQWVSIWHQHVPPSKERGGKASSASAGCVAHRCAVHSIPKSQSLLDAPYRAGHSVGLYSAQVCVIGEGGPLFKSWAAPWDVCFPTPKRCTPTALVLAPEAPRLCSTEAQCLRGPPSVAGTVPMRVPYEGRYFNLHPRWHHQSVLPYLTHSQDLPVYIGLPFCSVLQDYVRTPRGARL